jgi:glucose-1-phosphate thymidylyltransferase
MMPFCVAIASASLRAESLHAITAIEDALHPRLVVQIPVDRASDFATQIRPSPRGELEITDLNQCYLDDGSLHLERLGRGYAWLDTGTHQSLLAASNYVETIEARQGLRVCCPEEIAHNNGWIGNDQLRELAQPLVKNGYGQYLLSLIGRGSVG